MSFSAGLGVFGKDIEIAVVVKDASVDQFELGRSQTAPPIFLDQTRIGKFRLRIFVERLHIGMRRRRIEVIVKLLYILAVIALGVRSDQKAALLESDRCRSKARAQNKAGIGDR